MARVENFEKELQFQKLKPIQFGAKVIDRTEHETGVFVQPHNQAQADEGSDGMDFDEEELEGLMQDMSIEEDIEEC